MCTSLTLKSLDGKNFLGRTMDFPLSFNESVHLIPRNFTWFSLADKKQFKSKYATLGMSIVVNNHPIFADALNEKGLSCATLYFSGFAEYEKNILESKENLAPYDFVYWVLSQFKNIEEVLENIDRISLFSLELPQLGLTPPLHWIICDKTGKNIVIEKTSMGLNIIENPVGVMTNSPNIEWHLTNLRQYISISPKQHKEIEMNTLNLSAFGQGSGTFGLPGDYTPPSRFIRAAYLKSVIENIETEPNAITAMFHILESCSVPKGAVIKDEDELDYTLYISVLCNDSCTYYYTTYENHQISAINLLGENLDSTEIRKFANSRTQNINFQN